MALLTPNATYQILGVTVNEKIIPDGTRWTDAAKAKDAGFSADALYEAQKLLCGTGKAGSVTIHNTNDLVVHDDGEQYTRATWPNQNMGSARVHFYVDDVCAWQNLKAGPLRRRSGGKRRGQLARRGRLDQRRRQYDQPVHGDHHGEHRRA